uniref:Uncharacterized protein n=1 Tax=Magallana gigas TaxID=29159 RepID=A0A8W8L2R1_MAGGI
MLKKERAPSNNLSKKLANKDPKERAQLDKSALDNVTNIMDKQTTEVSIKQEGEKSKNRHHTKYIFRTGDRQDSSSEKKHVNNANVQDPPQEIKSVNIQPRISAKNRSVNSTETTHDVSKDNKSTKVKTDVSEESGKNKDSGTARKKSKVLREFVTINDVTPVSYTEHAEVKMKDIHESRVNESIIARKPDEKSCENRDRGYQGL